MDILKILVKKKDKHVKVAVVKFIFYFIRFISFIRFINFHFSSLYKMLYNNQNANNFVVHNNKKFYYKSNFKDFLLFLFLYTLYF